MKMRLFGLKCDVFLITRYSVEPDTRNHRQNSPSKELPCPPGARNAYHVVVAKSRMFVISDSRMYILLFVADFGICPV